MDPQYEWLLSASAAHADIKELTAIAEKFRNAADFHTAATALEAAFGKDPGNPAVRQAREAVLDRLSVAEQGIVFRYIPAGTFRMGSEEGDADEKPVRPVQLSHFWISQTPISWSCYCRIMDWEAPPNALPKGAIERAQAAASAKMFDKEFFGIEHLNRIRLQYCEDETLRARDWHAHAPAQNWKKGDKIVSSTEIFGKVERGDPMRPWGYDSKAMVCVGWEDVERMLLKLASDGTATTRYRLPTEAQWEKAARGGLAGQRYPWGDDPPTKDRCDFNRFDQFSILPMKRFAPNDYGLYAMSGGVWEWTSDWYDAEYYSQSELKDPHGPAEGKMRVVRGGSWTDCAEAVTVSFRMSMGKGSPPASINPNIGFRLCRLE